MANDWLTLIDLLDGANVPFDKELTDDEVIAAEVKYNFRFPRDLRDFLHRAPERCSGIPRLEIRR